MMARVETAFDPAIEARGFDKILSVVEVELRDGRRLTEPSAESYRGGPVRPLTEAELGAKFTQCASAVRGPDQIARALDALSSLESARSVRELMAVLQPEGRGR